MLATAGSLPAKMAGHWPIIALPSGQAPFDSQLRESIAFLRANRADAFPQPTTPAGTLSSAWSRYGTWAPVLRVGSFVVAYLLAWTLFLTHS